MRPIVPQAAPYLYTCQARNRKINGVSNASRPDAGFGTSVSRSLHSASEVVAGTSCRSRAWTSAQAGGNRCYYWRSRYSSCVSVELNLLSQNTRRKSNNSLVYIENCEVVNTRNATGVRCWAFT
jgi:hypothetical protein